MAKPKPNLSGALNAIVPTPAPAPIESMELRAAPIKTRRPKRTEETKLVGGQLPTRYSRSLNLLAAETGKTNVQLLEEALDKLFVAYGAKALKE